MSKSERTLEMANLICRFGKEKVMLDRLDEIVLPALTDKDLVRSYDKTRYFFHNVELIVLDKEKNVLGVTGRFIKDTVLQREQIFDDKKGLIHDTQSIRTSPSAIFLLILNNHRLLYVRETPDAPWLDTFKTTFQNFLRVKHRAYINSQYEKNKQLREEDPTIELLTKAELWKVTPMPTVELVPLASKETLSAFVNKYNVLKSVEVQLRDTNSEIDNEPFFDRVRQEKNAIGSKKTSVKHTNPEGLDKEIAIEQLSIAAPQGSYLIRLDGEDDGGDRLRGNNDDFKIRTPLKDLGDSIKSAANRMYASFNSIIENGLIVIPLIADEANNIVEEVIKRLTDDSK